MDKPFLVDRDIEEGRQLLRALDDADIPIAAAYWLYRIEKGRWRLVFAPTLDYEAAGGELVGIVHDLLRAGVAGDMTLDDVNIVSPLDPIATGLNQLRGSRRPDEFRPTGAIVNGLSLDDAYIYRTRPLRAEAKA